MSTRSSCMKLSALLPLLLFIATVAGDSGDIIDGLDTDKRIDYPDYSLGARYDEYPVVVPKRAALLLDRLMVALKNAMEEEQNDEEETSAAAERSGRANPKPRSLPSVSQEDTMGMQRRGHGSIGGQHKGRVYWRCYFNAVTCFRRK